MQSPSHTGFEALTFIGVSLAVLLVGCDAGAAPRETLPLDRLPIHANVQVPQHDALNAVLPAFDGYAYDESADAGADVPAPISAQVMLAALFPAQM